MKVFHFLKRSEQWKMCTIGFVVLFVAIKTLSSNVHLIFNKTDSLPYKAFMQLPKVSPSKGDYTLVASSWYGGTLIKKIIGVAGDEVTYTDAGELKVGSKIVGTQKSKNRDGRDLTPIKPQVIPEGYVFLHAPHTSSFDSRYDELGLIPVRSLQGIAYPILWRQ